MFSKMPRLRSPRARSIVRRALRPRRIRQSSRAASLRPVANLPAATNASAKLLKDLALDGLGEHVRGIPLRLELFQ